jgi:hypothetical protein
MGRKAHNGVKAAIQSFYFSHTEPFLDSIASGLIKRFVLLDIIFYFLIGKIIKFYLCNISFRNGSF